MPDPSYRYVRVALAYSNPNQRTGEEALFDAVIDDQDRIVGRWSLFGQWTELLEGNSKTTPYPMTILANGQIYFGPTDREIHNYSANIRDRAMRVGELCTVWSDEERGAQGGDEWSYRVRSVAVLGSKP